MVIDSGTDGPEFIRKPELTQKIREEIGKLFTIRKNKLHALQESLLQQAAARHPDKSPPLSPVDLLIPRETAFDIKLSIDQLHQATETCLQGLIDQGSSAIPDIASSATDVLGWLILLAVNESWLQKESGLLDRLLSANHIAIPLETEAGTEVVFARLRTKKPAKLTLGNDGVQVFNPNRLEWGQLELGISKPDRMTEIHKLIWKAVMKSDVLTIGDGELKQLKAILEIRYERGENYYIIIRAFSDESAILMKLRNDFPHLCAFLIGVEADEGVLVIPEIHLIVLIREFLLMLRKYHP